MRIIKKIDNFMLSSEKSAIKNIVFSISTAISTGLFVGKIKYAPGTFGSLLGLCFCIPFVKLSLSIQVMILFCLLVFGTISTHIYLLKIKDLNKDPKEVVIDEIFAMFLLTFLSQIITKNFEWHHFLSIFTLFRTFDILKPYPISYVDKNLHGAKGIMLDDIMASFGGFLVYILAYSK